MTPANYGSVFSCCLFGSLMMLYLYVLCRSKRFILRNEGTILNIEKRCDLINDSPKIRRNLFSQFIHIGSISLLFTLSLCFIFQPSSPAPNYDNDGTVIFDKPDSSNSFYIKRKDGKGYDLYVKHEDAFINTGIIENPEDYKSPKIYSSKKEATKFYENIK